MDSYIVKSVLNGILTEVEKQCKNVLPCKPGHTNGWHLFYRELWASYLPNLDQENLDHIKFSEMSKVGTRFWRKLSKEDMKEWNERGQLAREDEDCETAESLKCAVCDKHFKLRKELSFHEKNCCACQLQHCGKSFTTIIALKRHEKR